MKVLFEWSHHRILSADLKLEPPPKTESFTLAVKGFKMEEAKLFVICECLI